MSVRLHYSAAAALCLACCLSRVALAEEGTRLLRNPAMSHNQIVFVYANDIWTSGLNGGSARRLTSFEGAETEPHFSPDGSLIAFSGQYDGNVDVYVGCCARRRAEAADVASRS